MDMIRLLEEQELENNILKTSLDFRMMTDEYKDYRKHMHRTLCNYYKTIESALKERSMLETLLGSGSNANSKKVLSKNRNSMQGVIKTSLCIESDIMQMIELIRRDHVIMENTEERFNKINHKFTTLANNFVATAKNLRKLKIMRNRIQHANFKLNKVISSNREHRIQIRDHRMLKHALLELISKSMARITIAKNKINELMSKATRAIDEREEKQSMVLALKAKDKKERLIFDQAIKALSMSLRCDEKTFDFLTIKSNEKVELRMEENKLKLQEIMHVLEADTKSLKNFKETLECIQEICDEREVQQLILNFKQKEAENFALFNYITNLSGEVDELTDTKVQLQREIEVLQDRCDNLDVAHNDIMSKLLSRYRFLCNEVDKYFEETLDICKQLDNIGQLISTIFKDAGCRVANVEPVLGLNLNIRRENMAIYLADIERIVNTELNTFYYLTRKTNEESGMGLPVRADIKWYECPEIVDASYLLANPVDREAEAITSGDFFNDQYVMDIKEIRLKAIDNVSKQKFKPGKMAKKI